MTSTASLSSSQGAGDLDERILAQAALDAAEDNLQSLCASHAGTFVQVERRGKALQQGLADLLQHLESVQECTVQAQTLLAQDEDDGDRPTLAQLAENHRVRRRTLLQHSVRSRCVGHGESFIGSFSYKPFINTSFLPAVAFGTLGTPFLDGRLCPL